jgi:hypothetical protein
VPTNNVGYSFAPTFDNADMGRRGGSPPASSQQALEVLNFNLKPKVAGAAMGGFSPLVGQNQAGSSIGQAVLQSVLRTVLGEGGMDMFGEGALGRDRDPGLPAGMTPGQAPAPVIHPGGEGPAGYPIPSDAPPNTTPPPPRQEIPPGFPTEGRAPSNLPPRDFPPYDGPLPPLERNPTGGDTSFAPPSFGDGQLPQAYRDRFAQGGSLYGKNQASREVLL